MRPSTSLGFQPRPPSSHAQHNRPLSRLSARPLSRQSQRPNQPVPSRFDGQLATLVTQITGIAPDAGSEFNRVLQRASRNLSDIRQSGSTVVLSDIDQRLGGLIEKARVKLQFTYADALRESYLRLKANANESSEGEELGTKPLPLPELLQFLLCLSQAQERSTLAAASVILDNIRNPQIASTLTWAQILADDPYEGDHWEGAYDLPPGSFKSNAPPRAPSIDSDEWSQLEGYGRDNRSTSSPSSPESLPASPSQMEGFRTERDLDLSHNMSNALEELRRRQYWNHPGSTTGRVTLRPFDLGDSSTFGPSITRAFRKAESLGLPYDENYITEVDAVREVLFALQGTNSQVLQIRPASDGERAYVTVNEHAPRLLHLSLSSYISILGDFASIATTLLRLKSFMAQVFDTTVLRKATSPPAIHRDNKTLEAFSESVQSLVQDLEGWITRREETVCKAQNNIAETETVISLLSLHQDIKAQMAGTFDVLLEIVDNALHTSSTPNGTTFFPLWNPAALSKFLLDSLLTRAQSNLSIGDTRTAGSLMDVFLHTSQPLWHKVGKWLKDGAPLEEQTERDQQWALNDLGSDEEFFIRRNGVSLSTPEFWEDGFTVRLLNEGEEDEASAVPLFLECMGSEILSVGKAVGLIRALGVEGFFHDDEGYEWMGDWVDFDELIGFNRTIESPPPFEENVLDISHSSTELLRVAMYDSDVRFARLSSESLESAIRDYLSPYCQIAHARLNRILIDDCQLWTHVESIEDIFLMGRGDVISQFADAVFAKIEARQPWSDFHFLNTTLREALVVSQCPWINTSLVRLSYRGGRSNIAPRTVKAFEGLLIEYQTPFPLTYLFGPAAIRVYSTIFVLLLQIRRAKSVLESMMMKGFIPVSAHIRADELNAFYAMRGKLSWFVNAILNYIMTHVLHSNVLLLHRALKNASSIDEMISVHRSHLERLEIQCLLHNAQSNLHRTVISALDLCLTFNDTFCAFTGDTSIDISRHSLLDIRHHRRSNGQRRRRPRRSRFKRRQQRNYVGFVEDLPPESSDSSSSDDDEVPAPLVDDEDDVAAPNSANASSRMVTMSFDEETFVARVDDVGIKLDEYIRFVRKSVEGLGAESLSEDAAAFQILAFALEDWDL